jgi:hypothetical protein
MADDNATVSLPKSAPASNVGWNPECRPSAASCAGTGARWCGPGGSAACDAMPAKDRPLTILPT